MPGMTGDVKFAVQLVRKRPLLNLLIVSVLALGIAGNTAIFSLFNSLFLQPLPFPEPERLVNLDETAPRWDLEFTAVAYPDFDAWREHNQTFEAMAVYDDGSVNLALRDAARRIEVARVTHDITDVLRMSPLLGRPIAPEEDAPGGAKVALLGEALWREQFASRPDVLGETIRLDSEPYEIIGVLPPSAVFVGDADLWIPLATSVDEFPGSWYLSGIGRLKEGIRPEEAREDLHRIHKNLIGSRSVNEITSPVVLPILDRFLGDYRKGTTALLAAVGLVLLMACANVAGLMTIRAAARQRELGIRLALGAAPHRILRQLLTECLLLAALGGALGAVLGHGALRFVIARTPQEIPGWIRFELDARFLLFSAILIIAVTVLFGLTPSLRAARTDVQRALSISSWRASAGRSQRLRLNALVVGEVALALTLLIGAGFVIQSFREILHVDPGFRPEGVLAYQLSLPPSDYAEDHDRTRFFERHLDDLRALPGVTGAGAVSTAPLGTHEGWFFQIEDAPPSEPDAKLPVVLTRAATPGYFAAIGVTLFKGRDLEEDDGRTRQVAIVNETFARTFWPGESSERVIGKRIRPGGGDDEQTWLDVVGLTKDVEHYGLDTEMRPGVYLPFPHMARPSMTLVLRTAAEPEALVPLARDALRGLDPSIPMYGISTMSERIEKSLWPRRAASWFLSLFAGFALVLAMAGIYGVVSYSVNERTRELGIRMALGAERRQVLLSVLRPGMALILVGLGLGLLGALGASRLLSTFLFGVSLGDLRVYTLVIALVVTTGLLANWLPARRASRTDPMETLRAQ